MERQPMSDADASVEGSYSADRGAELNATGLFGKAPDSAATAPPQAPNETRAVEPLDAVLNTAPENSSRPIAEPVVHKFVLNEPGRAGPTDILDRMRMASASPAPSPVLAEGNAGFTQLLQSLGAAPAGLHSEPQPSTAARPAEPPPSSFTTLLQALNAPEPGPVLPPEPRPQPIATPYAEGNRSGSGGFTELLRTVPVASPAEAAPPPQPRGFELSYAGPAEPGAFTKLLTTAQGSGAPVAPAVPFALPKFADVPPAGNSTASFGQPYADAPSSYSATPPGMQKMGVAVPPGPLEPALDFQLSQPKGDAPGSASFSTQRPEGITTLLRRLDAPTAPAPPGPALSNSLAEPASPAPSDAGSTARFAPAVPAVPTAPGPAGHSEFTRIVDASRLRELRIRQGAPEAGASAGTPIPPVQPSAPPASAPRGFPVAGMPGVPGTPYFGGAPPAGYTPMAAAPVGASPLGYMPAAAMTPVAPTPQPPAPHPAPSPQTPLGKLQQFIPLFLILIILLLVGLLITMFFLIKR